MTYFEKKNTWILEVLESISSTCILCTWYLKYFLKLCISSTWYLKYFAQLWSGAYYTLLALNHKGTLTAHNSFGDGHNKFFSLDVCEPFPQEQESSERRGRRKSVRIAERNVKCPSLSLFLSLPAYPHESHDFILLQTVKKKHRGVGPRKKSQARRRLRFTMSRRSWKKKKKRRERILLGSFQRVWLFRFGLCALRDSKFSRRISRTGFILHGRLRMQSDSVLPRQNFLIDRMFYIFFYLEFDILSNGSSRASFYCNFYSIIFWIIEIKKSFSAKLFM